MHIRHLIVVYTTIMSPDLSDLPLSLHRASSFIIFAFAIFMIAAHSVIVAYASSRTSLSTKARTALPFLVGGFFAAWFAIAIIVGDGSSFPIPIESRRLASALAGLCPFIIAVIALFGSTSLRAVNAATPGAWLIAIQTYRAAGIMFIYPFLAYGLIPSGFAWPAGVGDALTGVFAPIVALMLARNRPHALKWAVAWNLFGILDLIVAPATALYFQARVLNIYPINLVPLFLGPPLGILTHIFSLRNLAVAQSNAPSRFPVKGGPDHRQNAVAISRSRRSD